jgi:hypothetical protein
MFVIRQICPTVLFLSASTQFENVILHHLTYLCLLDEKLSIKNSRALLECGVFTNSSIPLIEDSPCTQQYVHR